MKPILKLCLMLALALLPLSAKAVEPVRPGQETFLKRGVSAEGKVWLLSDAGQLFSIEEGKADRTLETLPVPVTDICRHDGELIAAGTDGNHWRVLRLDAAWSKIELERWGTTRRHGHRTEQTEQGGTWTELASGDLAKDEGLSALLCTGTVTLLTSKRLLAIGADIRSTPLKGKVGAGSSAISATSSHIYLGANWGEWSGLLQVIDRATGEVSPDWVPREGACTAIMCDNVTGITAVPWQPACVAISTGLMHMSLRRGTIWTLCPSESPKTFFSTPNYGDAFGNKDKASGTVAFYGLAKEGDGLLVVGADGLYHVTRDANAMHDPLPDFETIGGFKVSFALKDVILVKTDINSRRSVGGSVPMLIER